MQASTSVIEEVVRRLVEELDPERIILFGSRAWGRPDAGSDVDLLVIVPLSDERRSRRAARAYRCLSGVPVPVDLLLRTREQVERFVSLPSSLESRILEKGSVLYG